MSKLLGWLPRARWKRWLILTAITLFALFLSVILLVVTAFLLWRNPAVRAWVMVRNLRYQLKEPAQMPPQPRLSPREAALLSTNAQRAQSVSELFQPTNVWDLHLSFSSNQWARLHPNVVDPILHFMQPDGSVILRNPKASRNGLAGVFGLDFPWSEAKLEFGDAVFQEVGVRFKGNGTFVSSERSYKRPFKIDLHRRLASQRLAGRTALNLHNLVADASCLRDTMAYEFFKNAGVPAPRTAFVRLRLSIENLFTDRLLGLYVMVENPDAQWAAEQFGIEGVALFKPVTYKLFNDLGDDWTAYEGIYDPKTKLKPRQSKRLIALAKLVTHAGDAEFASQVGDFIDMDEFARFLACQVILANYDGILSTGQNFLIYLDPRTQRFGFVPWDLDHSWGEFPFFGPIRQREHASIWHPWLGENRFLERMLAVQAVRERYRRELERIRTKLFLPEVLSRRLDELAPVVRPFIAEESPRRLARFEREVGEVRAERPAEGAGSRPRPPAYSLKHFFAARAESVSQQLDGRVEGVVLTRKPGR